MIVTLQVMSYTMSKIQDAIDNLERRVKSVACNGRKGLLLTLRELGFSDRAGKAPGHRVFTHQELSKHSDYTTHSVDCGHKPNREMKFQYVKDTIGILRKYQVELEAIND